MFHWLFKFFGARRIDPTNFELLDPDASWVPGRSHTGRSLRAGSRLTRIFDADSAKGRYSPLDFNPKPIDPDIPNNRGRFSSTKRVPYAYMYAADGKTALQTTIWETINFHGISRRPDGKYLLPSRIFKGRAIQKLITTQPIYVVHVRDAKDAWHFKASITALQGNDQRRTRAWAHYIKRVVPETEGLRYSSHKYGKNDALVLFEDLSKGARSRVRKVKADGRPISISSRNGKLLVRDAMLPINVEFQ